MNVKEALEAIRQIEERTKEAYIVVRLGVMTRKKHDKICELLKIPRSRWVRALMEIGVEHIDSLPPDEYIAILEKIRRYD